MMKFTLVAILAVVALQVEARPEPGAIKIGALTIPTGADLHLGERMDAVLDAMPIPVGGMKLGKRMDDVLSGNFNVCGRSGRGGYYAADKNDGRARAGADADVKLGFGQRVGKALDDFSESASDRRREIRADFGKVGDAINKHTAGAIANVQKVTNELEDTVRDKAGQVIADTKDLIGGAIKFGNYGFGFGAGGAGGAAHAGQRAGDGGLAMKLPERTKITLGGFGNEEASVRPGSSGSVQIITDETENASKGTAQRIGKALDDFSESASDRRREIREDFGKAGDAIRKRTAGAIADVQKVTNELEDTVRDKAGQVIADTKDLIGGAIKFGNYGFGFGAGGAGGAAHAGQRAGDGGLAMKLPERTKITLGGFGNEEASVRPGSSGSVQIITDETENASEGGARDSNEERARVGRGRIGIRRSDMDKTVLVNPLRPATEEESAVKRELSVRPGASGSVQIITDETENASEGGARDSNEERARVGRGRIGIRRSDMDNAVLVNPLRPAPEEESSQTKKIVLSF